MSLKDKINDNWLITVLSLGAIIIGITTTVTSWFYERQKENIISKYEADISKLKAGFSQKMLKAKSDSLRLNEIRTPMNNKDNFATNDIPEVTESEKIIIVSPQKKAEFYLTIKIFKEK